MRGCTSDAPHARRRSWRRWWSRCGPRIRTWSPSALHSITRSQKRTRQANRKADTGKVEIVQAKRQRKKETQSKAKRHKDTGHKASPVDSYHTNNRRRSTRQKSITPSPMSRSIERFATNTGRTCKSCMGKCRSHRLSGFPCLLLLFLVYAHASEMAARERARQGQEGI